MSDDTPTRADKLRRLRLALHAVAGTVTPIVFGVVISQLRGGYLYAACAVGGLYALETLLAVWACEHRPAPRPHRTTGSITLHGADAERMQELMESLFALHQKQEPTGFDVN